MVEGNRVHQEDDCNHSEEDTSVEAPECPSRARAKIHGDVTEISIQSGLVGRTHRADLWSTAAPASAENTLIG